MIDIYRTAKPEHWKTLQANARTNRSEATPAERVLWQAIRRHQLGVHFRHQHAFDVYLLDFVCLSARLVVELDGAYHDDPDQAAFDEARSRWLADRGLRVLRYRNEDVLTDLEHVLQMIRHSSVLG